MPAEIKLEALTSTPPLEILRLADGSITIGREPENDVVVDSGAVSRRHACIIGAQSQWVFKDLESSNGSWINGVRLDAGQLKLIRPGDVIQVADFPIRLTEVHPDGFGGSSQMPSLLIFYRESFEMEFPLATPNSQFVLGGPEGDFLVEGSSDTQPLVTVTNTGGTLEMSTAAGEFPVLVNGLAAAGATALADRAEITIDAYRIIVSDMRTSISPERPIGGMGLSPEPEREIKAYPHADLPEPMLRESEQAVGWVSEGSRRKQAAGQKYLFGNDPKEADVNATGDFGSPGRVGRSEMSASQRFSTVPFEHDDDRGGKGMGETFLIIAGVAIFIFLIVFAVYLIIAMSSG